MKTCHRRLALALGISLSLWAPAHASSHREAPFIAGLPRADGADFYLFQSYEPGREGFVTLIANYLPLQDGYGAPNYFALDTGALYEIHVDNDGDAREDLSFQFRFSTEVRDLALDVGGMQVPIALVNAGPFGAGDTGNLNVVETYTLDVVSGGRRSGQRESVIDAVSGAASFAKPADNIGAKSIPDYAAYAAAHVHTVDIPGCGQGRVFVGQRKDSFSLNLGEIFDLVNTDPLGPVAGELDDLDDKNVTSLALEVPVSCLSTGADPVIGAWTTASLRQARVLNPRPEFGARGSRVDGGAWTQVSRLGMPLVNELVIGLRDKDRFNASEPRDDAQFADYVTHPTLPALIELLFPTAPAPTALPRTDLVEAFLTGIQGLNQPVAVTASEMLRLNTAIAATGAAQQSSLGVLAGDLAGFPNGRRPGDDVVDITLRVAMGVLLPEADAPAGQAPLTDGVLQAASQFDEAFPYLRTPIPGSPNQATP